MKTLEETQKHAQAAVDRSKEMIATIAKVKGENYARLIKHSVGLNMALMLMPESSARRFEGVGCDILTDLAFAYGVDLNDEEVNKELRSNILAVMPTPPKE